MYKLPTTGEMLEELVSKAELDIRQDRVKSFEANYEELVEFHAFLLAAYEIRDEYGNVHSFAQMGYFQSLHAEWLWQYRRLIEAVTCSPSSYQREVESLVS